MTNVVAFRPRTAPSPATRPRADISIWPSDVDGGSWAVDITSASGDGCSVINYFRCLDDAVAAARQWAVELDADFDDPPRAGASMSAALIDPVEVRRFIGTLHEHAAHAFAGVEKPGLLQLARLSPFDGKLVVSGRFRIGDIEEMVAVAIIEAEAGHNVYIEGRTVSETLRGNSRGGVAATVGMFVLVIDGDAHKGKAGVPIEATMTVETSPPDNRHHWLFLDRAVPMAEAQELGAGLRAHSGADSDTGNITQPYRVAGTPNYPDAKKLARGRTVSPTFILRNGGRVWTADELRAAFPAAKRTGSRPPPSGRSGLDAPDIERLAEATGTNRSDWLFHVVKAAKAAGLTVDDMEEIFRRYPDGCADKYLKPRDRLRREIERAIENANKWTRPLAGTAEVPPPRGKTVSLDEAQQGLADLNAAFFAKAQQWADAMQQWQIRQAAGTSPDEPEPTPPVHGLGLTLGGGKTQEALQGAGTALHALRAARDPRVGVMAVPEHKLSAEVAKRARRHAAMKGLTVRIWHGREAKNPRLPGETMCMNLAEVKQALAVMANVEREVCKDCPLKDGCAYLAQRKRSADLWLVAHPMLFGRGVSAITKKGIAFVVVDESPWQTGLVGVTGKGITLPLDMLDAGTMPLPPRRLGLGLDGPRLELIRSRLKEALLNEDDGPVRREALRAVGLEASSGASARALEWARKVKKGPWGERKDNKTLRTMSLVWKAVEALLAVGGPERSGRLALGRSDNGARILQVSGCHEIGEPFRVPTLLVDAMYDETLVKPYWPRIETVAELVVATPHMKVRQAAFNRYSKAKLAPLDDDAPPAAIKARAKNRRDVEALAGRIARENGGKTLLVGNKAVVEALNLPPGIEAAWFNAIAGRDTWGDVRTIIIVGQAQPKPADVERMAGALSGSAPMTVKEWHTAHPAPPGTRRSGKADSWYPRYAVTRTVRGVSVPGEADRHPDPICEVMRRRICEGEVEQAKGRGRGIRRTSDNPLDVFVLGISVLSVEIDELLTEEDVDVKPFDKMLAAGRVAFESPTDAFRAYPDMWPTIEAAKKDLAREKANTGTNPYRDIPIRKCPLVPVRYQRSAPKQKYRRAVIADSAAGARARLEALTGPLAFFQIVEAEAPQPDVQAAQPRPDTEIKDRREFILKCVSDGAIVRVEFVIGSGLPMTITRSAVTRPRAPLWRRPYPAWVRSRPALEWHHNEG